MENRGVAYFYYLQSFCDTKLWMYQKLLILFPPLEIRTLLKKKETTPSDSLIFLTSCDTELTQFPNSTLCWTISQETLMRGRKLSCIVPTQCDFFCYRETEHLSLTWLLLPEYQLSPSCSQVTK